MEVNVSLDIIKTSDSLSREDFKKLQSMFVKYYFEKYKRFFSYSSKKGIFDFLLQTYFSSCARKHLERIKKGQSVVVIKYRGDTPIGFMIGDIEGWKEAQLNEYYVEVDNQLEMRSTTLELYRVLLRELKNRGVQTLVASCRYSENKFIDALEMLGFEPIKEDDTTMKYGYRIKPL